MTRSRPSVAIVGAGMGGLAVAAALRRAGFGVHVYEQAHRFARIGAGIQMMPNSMKVLRALGVEERVRGTSFEPYSHLNRAWDSGEVMRELPMPESLFGAPYLCMHRGDLHAALASVVPAELVHPGKKLVGLDQTGAQVTLTFGRPTDLDYLLVTSGAGPDFGRTGRPKAVRLTYSDGTSEDLVLKDDPRAVGYETHGYSVSWVSLRVLSVYPSRQNTWVAISELEPFGLT